MTIADTIAQIEALEAKAMPSPWSSAKYRIQTYGVDVAETRRPEESDLIVALRNAAPGMIAYIRVLDKLKDAVDLWANMEIGPGYSQREDDAQCDVFKALAAAREISK